ncbi:hypothetical protein bpSLO_001171 (plasmid) [Borrelia parkeri]|uniref:BTA121 domain-containing protein surface lipoprotein n=1 Tax=Borrelia parkeri TaxID=141 RepID=UPI001FF16F70|nr:hypothetical protein [Borrelia parkeri]UPA11318.1 hypothetical protein bpSLO_001171 [Borrelia parkeri]
MKLSHFSLFLVLIFLLLLVVSCDLKSKGSTEIKENLTVKREVRKLDKFSGEYTSKMVATVDNLDIKLNNLLDKFGLLDKERESIAYIRRTITDANVGKLKGYRTYTDVEFHNLLESLGAARIKEIITFYLEVVNIQESFERAIKNIKDATSRGKLQNELNERKNQYQLHLKGLFDSDNFDDIYNKIIGDNYFSELIEFKYEIIEVEGGLDVYTWLSDDEQIVIDKIREIVTDPLIGQYKGYRTYTDIEFNNLLNKLGDNRILAMILVYLEDQKAQDAAWVEALTAIDSVDDANLREQLRVKINDERDNYKLHLKELFDEFLPIFVYRKFMNNIHYHGKFVLIKNAAKHIIAFKKLYNKLSSVQKRELYYIRIIVTNFNIGDAILHKTYNAVEFESLLGSLGAARVERIIDFHLNVLKAKEDARSAISSLPEGIARHNLQERFNAHESLYALHLKELFSSAFPGKVYHNVERSSYISGYFAIINDVGKIQ